MSVYRINIWRHGKLLGHFESATPWARDAARELAALLGAAREYRLEYLAARDERRLIESGPAGMRLVSSEPVFEAATLEDLG
ncbi:cytoplasmic protein [Massilia sp. IC2-477]|uniref:cytoplasmic protein n=1 Tax=Massilia sp. IC2-477 TaxID=2887198 RepID=UPI001D1152B8|nr:cytoplasmic protein [Massilia sp. IC2-477]MCC2957569.1 cytoplasmic protein [Massilia sp. IC2-477]